MGKHPFHQLHQRASSSSSLKRKILTPVLRQAFLFVRIPASTGISKHSLSFCFHSVHLSVPKTCLSFYTPASFYYYLYFLRQYLVKTDNSVLYTLPLCYNQVNRFRICESIISYCHAFPVSAIPAGSAEIYKHTAEIVL